MSLTRAKRLLHAAAPLAVLLSLTLLACAQPKKSKELWTDPADLSLPADFKYQGEYAGDKLGCQVIALSGGRFQAVIYPGGLPGDGWDRKHKSLMDGKLDGEAVTFEPTKGKRKYKAQKPGEFSATSKFPPVGQKDFRGTLRGGKLTITSEDGKSVSLKKVSRQSKTLGAKAPKGAVVLFDGTSTGEWQGGRLDKKTGYLNTDGNDIRTKKSFDNYTIHLEFLLPFKPKARDQGRGNSGFYQIDLYEVQVLDSFGLDGKHNECGGVYSRKDSDLNMCYPPLTWQTYDIDFTNAKRKDGKVVEPARMTIKLNGVVIHDNIKAQPTPGGRDMKKAEGTPGPFKLQGHGNPLQYRNIWVVEKK